MHKYVEFDFCSIYCICDFILPVFVIVHVQVLSLSVVIAAIVWQIL